MDDKKNMIEMLMPPQGKLALKGAAMLLGALQGCSPNSYEPEEESMEYKKGDDVCYISNGNLKRYKLLEDIKGNQIVVLAQDVNGKKSMINVENIRELGTCYE